MIPSQRHLFDIPEEIAYFNCAANAPLLKESVKRLHVGVDAKSHPWKWAPSAYFDDAETVRQLAAQVFGGEADGFATIPAASYGISTAARAIEPTLQKGDRLLIVQDEFPSVVLPLKRAAQETGAEIVTITSPDDGNWTQAIKARLDNRVKVVAISSCHWTNGAYIDLVGIGEACRAIGSTYIIDATQTLGAMPFPIDHIQPDFLVAAGYKWLLAPYGFGLLYVAKQWRESRPLEETWLVRERADQLIGLLDYPATYMPGARRFEVGEKCAPTLLPGAIAALEQLREWGIKNIADSLAVINHKISNHLEQLGFGVPDEKLRCPHLFGATVPNGYDGNLVEALARRHVYVSQRANSIRFAPHLHINENDVNKLLEALSELMDSR